MIKNPFLKKRNHAGDSLRQEKLAAKYFDDLKLNEQHSAVEGVEFDGDKVYNRINALIDQQEGISGSYRKKLAFAASVFAVVSLSALAYQYRIGILNIVDPIPVKELVATNGQVVNYTLSDGTKIWLNGGSKLTYPETFRGDTREVSLVGEAFLDVAHNAKSAFIVHTGAVKTQVLGTSFNVKAYPEEEFVKVDVVSGKVGVIPASIGAKAAHPTVFLTPAEEVIINRKTAEALKSSKVHVAALTGWKDGGLVFKNMALPEVLNAIQHRFNVKIKADENLANCSISANFTNVSLPNIMVIISKLVKGKATPVNGEYHLKGKGC